MGLFANIYNKVANFFNPQEPMYGEASKSVASNRLKLVLMQDRTNLTPKVLEQMRLELVNLLSKYLEMDKELLELNFEQEGDQVALMLSIPVIRAKDEEEIEAALAEEKKEKETEETEEDDESEGSETEEVSEEDETEVVAEEESSVESSEETEEDEEETVEYFDEDESEDTPVKYTKGKKVTTPNPFKAEESESVKDEVSVEQ